MWSPTHIQVTVQKARGLLTKGKNGKNNCFVTIGLGKEKYQTSIKQKATEIVEWHEECELSIPDKGNRAELVLTCLHRNNLGIDEFLGQITLPLNEMDVYDRPRSKWYQLESKPGKEKKKERGEMEIRILFVVKSGSMGDLSKKQNHKSSVGQLASSVGGSLLSLGTMENRKRLKKFAKSLGSKMHKSGKSAKGKDLDSDSYTGSFVSIGTPKSFDERRIGQTIGDADPGVISEDEDEFVFDNLSHKSSGSSLNMRGVHHQRVPSPLSISKEEFASRSNTLPPSKPPRSTTDPKVDEWEAKLYGKHLDIGSNDSLKYRTLEGNRISLPSKEIHEEPIVENSVEIPQPVTAPTTPLLKDKEKRDEVLKEDKPTPLSRSNTLSCIVDNKENKDFNEKQEKSEKKRFSRLRYFRREKHDGSEDIQKQFGERIIIGHENNFPKQNEERCGISQATLQKYEGKSREEVISVVDGLERDLFIEKQRVKELEDYLDNLLLRVMETHPKILQNPYTRNTSTKSG